MYIANEQMEAVDIASIFFSLSNQNITAGTVSSTKLPIVIM